MISSFRLAKFLQRKKVRLSQLVYTCLDGVISVIPIVEKYKKSVFMPDINNEGFIPAYYEFMNDLFLFQAHIGRISEMAGNRIPAILKGMKTKEDSPLWQYYKSRNSILHSHRILISFKGIQGVKIPNLEGQSEIISWKHKEEYVWSDFASSKLQSISNYIQDTFSRFLKDLEIVFQTILSFIKSNFPELFQKNIPSLISATPQTEFVSGSTEDPTVLKQQKELTPYGPISQSDYIINKKK